MSVHKAVFARKQGQGDRNYSPQHRSDKLKNDEKVNKIGEKPFVANLTARLVQELKIAKKTDLLSSWFDGKNAPSATVHEGDESYNDLRHWDESFSDWLTGTTAATAGTTSLGSYLGRSKVFETEVKAPSNFDELISLLNSGRSAPGLEQ